MGTKRTRRLVCKDAMLHYRCLSSYIPKTALEHISDTTELLPAQNSFPSLFPEDAATSAAADPTEALQHPTPSIPIPHLGEKQTMALKQLAAIFNMNVPQALEQPPGATSEDGNTKTTTAQNAKTRHDSAYGTCNTSECECKKSCNHKPRARNKEKNPEKIPHHPR